ncbi:hypothetical protein VHEMI03218 [[Torrubiella] hemipterigena]|uniref:Amidase domain-containing protein n=1 Tax=[Torrubiella] hemipterigena TaxID=1531966 RepID=A0A0A1SS11_9HYPO|nr:hypothetical protein VHEMI03218 [[Torrubiella] hemipterigena]
MLARFSFYLIPFIGVFLTCTLAASIKARALPGLLDATLEELRAGLDRGTFTSVDLTKAYLGRITETQNSLNAIIQLNPDALTVAEAKDYERKEACPSGGPCPSLGALHGIPVILKDNIATFDSMDNTAGSYALVGAKVPCDSTIASKLRSAGVILLGKANLSQWAAWRTYNYDINAWSSVGGRTKGAYYKDQSPGGSSSGSGVASSVGLAWASLGSETAGSIISPAYENNVVGIKPTVGLTSRYLVVPISQHQDSVGPLARTVKDAAVLLSAIAGTDHRDNYTSSIPFATIPDYTASCMHKRLDGVRLGMPKSFTGDENLSDNEKKLVKAAVATLRSLGATVVEGFDMPGSKRLSELNDVTWSRLGIDFISDAPNYFNELSVNPHNISSVQDLVHYTRTDPRENYPEVDTKLWDDALAQGFGNTDARFWNFTLLNYEIFADQGIDWALRQHDLDMLVGHPYSMLYYTSAIGYPVMSVPAGSVPVEGGGSRPVGFGFTGTKFSEEKMFRVAYAFEQATTHRNKLQPMIVPKTELKDVILH